MLSNDVKRRIDGLRDTLVGKLPDPKAQVEQITIALVYKFMSDMDDQSLDLGGMASFFKADADEEKDYSRYSWRRIMSPENAGDERVRLYMAGLERMPTNPNLPVLFNDIFRGAFLPYRDPETLRLFLTGINDFSYGDSESLGDAFEYLLSVLGSQGDAGQFRTPRHIIDMMVAVVNPQKEQTVLDPACGTAGFLISAYKHILAANADTPLSPDESQRLLTNFCGYDISPDMVRLSRVNLYLHRFPAPRIYEYDTLTSDEHWDDRFDIIMANPPFMSPKGGIRPHNRFAVHANRSEVLFVDYIAEHLNPGGRAGVIVPEGIVFQSANAYKQLRKLLVDENYLVAVVSLPAGVFNPYSGVKTSILFMDKTLARRADSILFVKVANDGFGLGAQRREVGGDELPWAADLIRRYQLALQSGQVFELDEDDAARALLVPKSILAEQEYALAGERYRINLFTHKSNWPMMTLGEVCEFTNGLWQSDREPLESVGILRNTNFTKDGRLDYSDIAEHFVETRQLEKRLLEVGDIILEKSGGSDKQAVGRVAYFNYASRRLSFSNFTSRMRVTNDSLIPKFLWALLYHAYQSGNTALMQSQTSGIRNLDLDLYKAIQIPLPPLEVQREIVAEVEGYQRVIDGARQVVESYKPHIAVDPAWPLVKLGDLCKPEYGFTEKACNSGDARFIRITDISEDGSLRKEDPKYVVLTGEAKASLLAKGDLLVARTGATFGKTMLFNEDYPAVFASYLIRLRFPKDHVLPGYYWVFSQSDAYWSQARSLMSGGGQPQFNGNALKQIEFPLPPLIEQQRIVAEIEREQALVSASRELVALMEAKIKACIARVWARA